MPNQVLFPGVTNIVGARFTLSRGAAPSRGTISIVPQDGLSAAPQAMTWQSDSDTLTFPGCTLDLAHLRERRVGKTWRWEITVYDRRLYWGRYQVDGNYNERLPNGLVKPDTQKSARELARLILNGIGEGTANVDGMPANVYPRCRWAGANAAAVLQWLCEYCSCAIGFDTSNRVQLMPYGVGADLPSQRAQTPRYRYNIGTSPQTLLAVGGPTVYQSRLRLEAVSLEESTNTLKPMEFVESKPANGWEYEPIINFPNVSTDYRDTVFGYGWRGFRVYSQADGSTNVPGCPFAVSRLSQMLPFKTELPYLITDVDGGNAYGYPLLLRGDYWPMGDTSASITDSPWPGQFAFNEQRGLVLTEFPIININSVQQVTTPTLYLTTAYNVRHGTTGEIDRVYQTAGVGGVAGTKVLVRPEVFGSFVQLYGSGNSYADTVETRTQANSELQAYLAQFQRRYQTDALVCEMESYPAYYACPLDGKLAQITLEYGYSAPPRMTVSTGYEHDIYNKSFEESEREFTLQLMEEAA